MPEETHGSSGETETARFAAFAAGPWDHFRVSWLSQALYAPASNDRSLRQDGIPRLFRLYRRSAGIFWRDSADRGAIHASCGSAACGRNGGRTGEGAWTDFQSGERA